ncbi:MAG TPA: SLC13 family permease [Nitrososphaeraceae archaeon]|nr:SLC13 family permease [Nitrososphaeraceae archaeon]
MTSGRLAARIGLFLGPLLFLFVSFFPLQQLTELSFESRIVLASTVWMATWWITEAIPIYVTALLPLVIFPFFHVMDIKGTSANYADQIIFLFLGGFLLAKGLEKSNLHKRFAFTILKIFGTNPKYIVAAFMGVTWLLGAWMSNTATTILMLPIALSVISLLGNIDKQGRFVRCLLLSIAYAASISGVTTLISTPANAIFASLATDVTGTEVTFAQWISIGFPIGGISLVVAWLYMIRFGSKITDIKSNIIGEKDIITKKLKELGNLSRDEKIVAIIFIITITAWITRGLLWKDFLPSINDSTIAIASAISLFLIPSSSSKYSKNRKKDVNEGNEGNDYDGYDYDDNNTNNLIKYSNNNNNNNIKNHDITETSKSNSISNLLDWNTAIKIPWGVLILMGGGLALAHGFTSTGLDEWIASNLSIVSGMPFIVIILIFVIMAIVPSELISNTATAAILIPIAASLATSIGINPLFLMAPVAIASSYGFIMPVGTPPNAIVYSSGYITARQMARAGLPLDIISIIMVTILTSIFVPLVFGIG